MRTIAVRVGLVLVAIASAACGGDGGRSGGERQTLRIGIGSDPPSVDPALLTDTISGAVALNVNDPLVRIGEELEPEPALAESWEVSEAGRTVTFRLRDDGRWTNGDAVTAHDFEYAWKRVLAPETASPYAYRLFGIVGAEEYNACKRGCARARAGVGVEALDERRLAVRLVSPQPWFLAEVSATPYLAVHRATVERHGDRWTEPANIVTNGPFRLTRWRRNEALTLERWEGWRDADSVAVGRIEARVIAEATTALAAFEAGELDACLENACIPSAEVDRLEESETFVEVPALLTQYFGVGVAAVPDVHLRRALALALDRRTLVEQVTRAGETPATSLTPEGMPGFDQIEQDYLGARADLAAARAELERARTVPRSLELVFVAGDPNHEALAVAAQAMWRALGIRVRVRAMEWASFLESLGPPLAEDVDLYLVGWVADFADAFNFLEAWTCRSGNNFSRYCDAGFDRVVAQARATPEAGERYELYARAEAILTGPDGDFPLIPLYWSSLTTLRKPYVDGWRPNALGRYDFTAVSLEG